MSDQAVTGRPWHLWVVAILALLWNSIGCIDFTMVMLRDVNYLENAGFSREQMEFFFSYPNWARAIWGAAVYSAILGGPLLLIRSRTAVLVYRIGLITYVAAMIRQYGFTEFTELFPETHYKVFSVIIFIIALAQLLYARAMTSRGVLT